MFHAESASLISGFATASGFKVEFLTPNRGDRAYESALAPMPVLGKGIGAQVLRFLDFLIRKPVSSIVLHDAGIPVTVPSPERFAVHKIIVATLRTGGSRPKIAKDIAQVANLLEAFAITNRKPDVGFAWMEAWERGASWRRRLLMGALRLSDESLAIMAQGVRMAASLEGVDHKAFGISGGREGIVARLSKAGKQGI
jgi:hypothetical protein